MFKQLEYSEILFKNSLQMFNRCTHDEGSTYNDLFSLLNHQMKVKVSDAQQVVGLCQYFQKHYLYYSNQQFHSFYVSFS